MLRLALLLFLVPLTAGADLANTRNRDSAIGINLRKNLRYVTAVPWVNAMKMAQRWRETPSGGGGCRANSQVYSGAVDGDGYPLEMGSRVCVYTQLFPSVYEGAFWPIGQWVLRYDGDATFDVSGAASNPSVANGRGTFDMGTSNGGLNLEITAIADPPGNIRLYPPGGICARNASPPYDFEPWSFCSTPRCPGGTCNDAIACGAAAPHCIDLEDAGQGGAATFHPLWLSRFVDYRTLRFMDWLHTNDSKVVDFADWQQPSHFSWEYRIPPGNVPLAVIASLCNTLNAECYVNVPHQATDAHIVEFATFFRDHVAAHLPIYLEYSNEVWNGTFSQKQYSYEQGEALPDTEFDGSGCLSGQANDCSDSFYGKRTFEMCSLAQQVFDAAGTPQRLVCVMARQAANPARLGATLDCPRWLTAPGGNCYAGSDVDVVALAPYFGDASDCTEAASVTELCARMDADVAAEYCPTSGCFVPRQFAELDARGLSWPIMSYEGGSHQSDTASPICVDVATHPCIRQTYIGALDAWKDHFDLGGRDVRQYLQFDSIGHYSNVGNLFGARGSMEGDSDAWPKEDGLLDWKNTPGNECWWPSCALPPASRPVPAVSAVGSRLLGLGLAIAGWRVLGRRRTR